MSRLDKFRAFTLKEFFILLLAKTANLFSKALIYSDDFRLYSRAVSNLISNGYNIIRINENTLEISNKGDRYFVRRYGSDITVFEQIVINEEYSHVLSLINKAGLKDSALTIVDCGSNIGLFSAWIMNRAKVEKIISIEADKENYSFHKYFISQMKYENRIELLNRAIWSDSSSVLRISSEFRDGLQWSKSVVPAFNSSRDIVNSISLNKILDDFTNQQIHILKIDIEGAEKVVFENKTSFDRMLENTKIIAIEIHKEVESTDSILKILQSNGFVLEEFGETTFGYKK